MGGFRMKNWQGLLFGLSFPIKGYYHYLVLRIVCFAFPIGIISLGCNSNSKQAEVSHDSDLLDVVHPRYLDYPRPSAGMEVKMNPPVLSWPAAKGKEISYEVRLSVEKDFSDPEKILAITDTPWAMFNPHQQLERGTWYWQYRKIGAEWSDIQYFMVGESAVPMVSPSPKLFLQALPEDHPRVLATTSDLAILRNLEPTNDSRSILTEAEKALFLDIPKENHGVPKRVGEDEEQERKLRLDASLRLGNVVYNTVLPLCEGYVLTGKEEYANKAIQVALEIATWDPSGVSGINDFGDARCMLAMALVYDTFNDKLGADQKSTLLQSITFRASRFYSHWINNIEVRVLSGHVWQHILHYFFQTSLAVIGDEPKAEAWLAYAYELFLARAPVLGGMDGGWAEGVSYFRMNMETLIDIPLYIKKFTGFDFINTHPWYRHQVDWMIYHMPPGSAPDGFADNTEEMDLPGPEYRAFALELAKLTGDPKAAWYANACLEYDKTDLSEKSMLRWVRLTKTRDLDIPDPMDIPELPMGRSFKDIGVVAMHSEIAHTSENLMVAMRSSPFGSYGHMLSDQNVFNILYGGKKLFYRTGYKVAMKDPHRIGWYQHTKSQNGLMVDGQGQPYSTESFGWISRFLQGDDLAYAKGDASNAYRSLETGEDYSVLKNHRHLVLLKPDVILIYDDLAAKKDVEWNWLIHSLSEMVIDRENQTFSVAHEDAKGLGRLWASERLFLNLSDTFDVAAVNWRGSKMKDGSLKSYSDEQYHLKASNSKKNAQMRFFAVIQVGKEVIDADLMAGMEKEGVLEVHVGNWTIRANLTSDLEPGIQVRNMETKTVFESHGKPIHLGNASFEGKWQGSARLGFLQNSLPVFLEAKDELPYEMVSRIRYFHTSTH